MYLTARFFHNAMVRLVPIMLLKLPIMLWSNAPEFSLLCSNYAPLYSTNSTFSLSYHI